MVSKFHDLSRPPNDSGETWADFFQHAFGGTAARPVALELRQTKAGAIIARGIAAGKSVKIFRTDTDAERETRNRVTKNYFEALDRIGSLPKKNRHPEKFNATAFNVLRGMAPGPADSVSVDALLRRLIDRQDHEAGTRDRRKEYAYRAIKALVQAGHIYYRPAVDDEDRIALTETDDGGFDRPYPGDDWLDT